ncbi:MAG: sulfatase-like hydrolase/transferase [Albidovulum sp.]|nr:sulfatase-like hydrolase/transferase [Albidovulum sp.]
MAQYDGAIAYMDSCIQTILNVIESRGVLDDTIIMPNSDHGETLYEHEYWVDHRGLYDSSLLVPLIIRYPSKIPAVLRLSGYNQLKDFVPTLLELAEIDSDIRFDGRSPMGIVRGELASYEAEIYITERTWMRMHGWRTPQWKLIRALEPDFHFKPPVELSNLVEDPDETTDVAAEHADVVEALTERVECWIAVRESETGLPNPIFHQGDWHGHDGIGAFTSSQQACDTLYIGDSSAALRLSS